MVYDVEHKREEWQLTPAYRSRPAVSKLTQWVINNSHGFIKDEKQANYALIIFIIISTVWVSFLLSSWFSSEDMQAVIPNIPPAATF